MEMPAHEIDQRSMIQVRPLTGDLQNPVRDCFQAHTIAVVPNRARCAEVGKHDVYVASALRNEVGYALERCVGPHRVDAVQCERDILLDYTDRVTRRSQ
jgi:hypothetical protein